MESKSLVEFDFAILQNRNNVHKNEENSKYCENFFNLGSQRFWPHWDVYAMTLTLGLNQLIDGLFTFAPKMP